MLRFGFPSDKVLHTRHTISATLREQMITPCNESAGPQTVTLRRFVCQVHGEAVRSPSSHSTRSTAVRRAPAVAVSAVTGLVTVADRTACAAVVPIGLSVRADAVADVEPGGALATPAHTVLAARTRVTTRAAVRRVSRGIDASARASGGARAAVGAAHAVLADLTRRASVSAGPAVLGIEANLHAGSATVGHSATASAHGRTAAAPIGADLSARAGHATAATI
jgi:hypothetical protein